MAGATTTDTPRSARTAARNLAIGGAIFAVAMALTYRYLWIYGRSIVWIPDGAAQHFPAIYYLTKIVHEFVAHPSAGFPFWSWKLGMGADTISTLSFYGFGDPFAPIAFLFPLRRIEAAFTLVYFARVACAGLFSALYLRKMGARPFAAVVGSLLYTFTTFLMFFTMHHPPFATPFALFPLLLLGGEYALERRRYWVLVAAVFMSASGNFYFFYMALITFVIYIVARYFEVTPATERWKRLLPDALRIAGCVVLGSLFAAPVLVPSAVGVLSTARRQVAFSPPLFFTAREYWRTLGALVSTNSGPNYTAIGFLPLGFVLIPALFLRRGNRTLKLMLVAFPLFMASPLISAVYNGFTFPTGRYGFQWGLFIALAAALLLSDDEPFSGRELLAMLAGYLVLWGLVFAFYDRIDALIWTPFAYGLVAWAIFGVEWLLARRRRAHAEPADPSAETPARGDWSVPVTRWLILGLTLLSIGTASTFQYDIAFASNLRDNLKAHRVMTYYRHQSGASAALVSDSSPFYRVQDSEAPNFNEGTVQGNNSTGFYFSIMNGSLNQLFRDHMVRMGWSTFAYHGLDDRAALDELAAVKYYTADTGREAYVPYGFRYLAEGRWGKVYANDYALPLGVVYDKVITRTEFEKLPTVARQQAVLEGALVEDGSGVSLPSAVPSVTVVDVPFRVSGTKGATVDLSAHRIVKNDETGTVTFSLAAPADAELYVQMLDFNDVPSRPLERQAYLLGPNPTPKQVADLKQKDRRFGMPAQINSTWEAGGPPKLIEWQRPGSRYYTGNDSLLVNLGYKRSVATTAAMSFFVPGTLTYKSLNFLAVPMDAYGARAERLRSNPMRKIRVANNTVSGEVDSAKDGLLFLSIPYSTGWSAKLDGKPVRALRVNSAFIGIPVTAGKHAVELHYTSPGLKAGLLAALVAAVIAGGLALRARRSRARDGEPQSE